MINTRIILITHEAIGQSFLDVAQHVYNKPLEFITVIPVQPDSKRECITDKLSNCCQITEDHKNILLLTDLFGATPANIAQDVKNQATTLALICGLNMPMLIRAINYIHLPFKELIEKVVEGGKMGIFLCNQ